MSLSLHSKATGHFYGKHHKHAKSRKLEPYQEMVEKQRKPGWDEVINFYDHIEDDQKPPEYKNPYAKDHGMVHPARFLIVGATGAGKTNIMLNIIKQMHCFERIFVFCKLENEPLYAWLKDSFHGNVIITSDLGELPDLSDLAEEADKENQGLVIFDDTISMSKAIQMRIQDYFIAARKCNLSAAYITQAYYATPKVIRIQCNYVFFLRTNSEKDFKLITREYCFDRKPEELQAMYREALAARSFFWISIDEPPSKRYRLGFGGVFQ